MNITARSSSDARFARLSALTGHLRATTSHERQALADLEQQLASSVIGTAAPAQRPAFAFERSDFFSTTNIDPARQKRLHELTQSPAPARDETPRRVFVRDVPVRSDLLRGSVPAWAAGAAVERSLGPFVNADGRQVWFDLFRTERLVSLYLAGQSTPAILFPISLLRGRAGGAPHPAAAPAVTYRLVAGSVWFHAQLLAAAAPATSYVGLRVRQGQLSLSALPTLVGDRLTLPAGATVTVELDLDPAVAGTPDPASPFGADARQAEVALPTRSTFHFTAAGGKLDTVEGALSANVYGQSGDFVWTKGPPTFEPLLNRVLVPLRPALGTFTVRHCESTFTVFSGEAATVGAAWALPVAELDFTQPLPAAGIGGLGTHCGRGITAAWTGLRGGPARLTQPWIVCDPGRIFVVDAAAASDFASTEFSLWTDAANRFGSTLRADFGAFPFNFTSVVEGTESRFCLVNAHAQMDRPVAITGVPFDVRSKNSALIVSVTKAFRLFSLSDDNLIFDHLDPTKPYSALPPAQGLALRNALFKVTPVNGCAVFGLLDEDMVSLVRGISFLTFGVYAYVPTLPDPYAADLKQLREQFTRSVIRDNAYLRGKTVWLWLVARTGWEPAEDGLDTVDVSFHFTPLETASGNADPALAGSRGDTSFNRLFCPAVPDEPPTDIANLAFSRVGLPDYQREWNRVFGLFQLDDFALLDVSSNADQMGVSFASFGNCRASLLRTFAVVAENAHLDPATDPLPFQAQGVDVVARGEFVRAFTVPQISWEPVINWGAPPPPENPTAPPAPGDPPLPLNYYGDDGGATKIGNNSRAFVPIAPLPVADFLVAAYRSEPDNVTAAFTTLPFGLRALAFLYRSKGQARPPTLSVNRQTFANDLTQGLQLELKAGSGFVGQSDLFRGATLQMNNVLNASGAPTGTSTLGHDVTVIFNGDFYQPTKPLDDDGGVPVTRLDVSGYGASTFSHWENKKARFASTSQARFDVMVGRTGIEVIQVRSMMYPCGVRLVRTITLFRAGSGYMHRVDSGWQPESDGRFDFRFEVGDPPVKVVNPYEIHPGVVRGVFNVRNIRSANRDILPFLSTVDLNGFYTLLKNVIVPCTTPTAMPVNLEPVYYDADVELEDVVQGHVAGRVPAKKLLGFVQLAPRGVPLPPQAFRSLLERQFGAVGGPLDCIVDIAGSGQKLRVNAFDVNAAMDAAGTKPVFVAAARGNAVLPKEGSWSLVTHAFATGDVTPLPESSSVPLIRIGSMDDNLNYPVNGLLRLAHPAELLRAPGAATVNFGFLQSTNTQKVLFLTPAFGRPAAPNLPGKLLSRTPPLFADAYRIARSKGIFPNIGNAVTGFGDVIALTAGFVPNVLQDAGKAVLEVMSINSADGVNRLKEDGYKLLNAAKTFDLPDQNKYLINEDYLKVFVEYKASGAGRGGKLNYNVDSYAADVADRWKSRMNNLAMVVDLGPIPRLLTITGNFDARKGAEPAYVGDAGDPGLPTPKVEFSPQLKPIIDLLQILSQLQGGDYAAALKSGLKIAMSNHAGGWEYKFEAAKEIPLVRFPPGFLFNDPNAPLKLEASMRFGVYFNAALTTAALSDPKKLLPVAGAFLDFHGSLSVMCVSLSIATIYAVGHADLRIAGDTGVGPSLQMKFGFGAQVVVGLPVVGNVSVLYMVGVEIYLDPTTLRISAFLLFQGHAELLAGLISVTITIEAKGSIERSGDRTSCIAQVTFGLDISLFLVIDISFSESWEEERQIA